jgi:glycosyltransferase involved in cell wall biosynthesis
MVRRILASAGPDVVHVNVSYSFLGWSALRAARRLRIPAVAHVHAQPEGGVQLLPVFNRPGVLRVLHAFQNRILRRADAIVIPSTFGKTLLLGSGLSQEIAVISNGVETATFTPGPAENSLLRQRGLAGKQILLMVGRLMPSKNHVLAVRALAILAPEFPDLHLVAVGEGLTAARLRALAGARGIAARVHFPGRVPGGALVHWYRSALALVHSSRVELEGLAVLEAMACGIPVVVARTPTSAAAELFTDGVEGFAVSPDDPDQLAERLRRLLADRALRERMGNAGRTRAEALDIERSVDQMLALYRALLARRGGR